MPFPDVAQENNGKRRTSQGAGKLLGFLLPNEQKQGLIKEQSLLPEKTALATIVWQDFRTAVNQHLLCASHYSSF